MDEKRYYIAIDENGQPYIEHGFGERAHSYLLKLGNGAKVRYFYTQQQIDAWKKRREHQKAIRETDRKVHQTAKSSVKERDRANRKAEKLEKKAEKWQEKADKKAEKARSESAAQNKADKARESRTNAINRGFTGESQKKTAEKWQAIADLEAEEAARKKNLFGKSALDEAEKYRAEADTERKKAASVSSRPKTAEERSELKTFIEEEKARSKNISLDAIRNPSRYTRR